MRRPALRRRSMTRRRLALGRGHQDKGPRVALVELSLSDHLRFLGTARFDDDIAAVANYVTARFGAKGAQLTGNDVANLRKQSTQQPKSQEAPNG